MEQFKSPAVDFEPISSGSGSLYLPDEVVSNLITDQQLMYKYWVGITTGKMRGTFAKRKIKPVMHPDGSPWLPRFSVTL